MKTSLRPTVRILAPRMGAEISDVDLRKFIDCDVIAQIRSAVLKYKVVVFRKQDLTIDEFIRFARNFGEPRIHPATPVDQSHREVLHLRNGPNSSSRADLWHSDGSYSADPFWGGVLRSRVLPPVGGDTVFIDMEAVLEYISPAMAGWLSQLSAVHDMGKGFSARVKDFRENTSEYDLQDHPVIVTHPETGKRILYVNPAFTARVHGLEQSESDWLLNHLAAKMLHPEHQLRISWEPNMIVFWDNWALQHYGSYDYLPAVREMERIALTGALPFSQPPLCAL